MVKDKNEMIPLETGDLNIREIDAVLNTLPVDITFVGSSDEVRFFNRIKDRVFTRARGVIGKKVQNCHPKKSLDTVTQILRDFKAGKRNSAEFWIDLDGRLILIRYFPVRDDDGGYLGCLEVSQDITEIKKIEGEKRLLD